MTEGVSRAEIVGVFAAATELALGAQPGTFLRATLLAVGLARRLGWAPDEVATVYWYSLLRYAGCHAENHSFAALIGDEVEFNRRFSLIDTGSPRELIPLLMGMMRAANSGRNPLAMAVAVASGVATSRAFATGMIAGHCDVAQKLAERLGCSAAVVAAVGQFRERWDGKGLPQGLRGEAVLPAVRLVALAHDAMLLEAAFGREEMLATMRQRSGAIHEPELAEPFLEAAQALLAEAEVDDPWAAVIADEPGEREALSAAQLDEACLVIADFCDLQVPDGVSHSRVVAELVETAGRTLRLPDDQLRALRLAALLHDIGYAALPVRARGGYPERAGMGDAKLHPFHGEQLLSPVTGLLAASHILGRHHEACDGSGYFRGLNAASLPLAAKVLGTAEAYQSVREGRFGAAPLSASDAAAAIRAQVQAGKLDGDVAKAVLAAAGHRTAPKKRELVAGLTNRELDILRLAATGLSMKEVGKRLGISPKTVDNHLQNLYPKIGVRTRAGATLFAIEHGLCEVG